MYIFFFIVGFLALSGQLFAEGGFFRKGLVMLSIFSFLGLGYLAYQDVKTIETLNFQLTTTKENLDKMKKYEYISRLTHTGSEQIFFYASNPYRPLIPQGLPEILIGSYETTDELGSIAYKCNIDSQKKYDKAIKFNPDYPFSYLALAYCKKQIGEKDWFSYANKAMEIFGITTEINGHNSEHDVALKILQNLLIVN